MGWRPPVEVRNVASEPTVGGMPPAGFGDRRADFEADLRHLLLEHSPNGLFWDWPGDTELVIASKTQTD